MQVLNNANTKDEFTTIQSGAMIVKLMCFLFLIIEIIIFVWEMFTIRQMRELKLEGFEQPTEEERRKKYSKKISMAAIGLMGVFIVVLILGIALTEGKTCLSEAETLENGACVSCKDGYCQDCTLAGPDGCDECKAGYSKAELTGKCSSCNPGTGIDKCLKCSIPKDKETSCNKCVKGYRLENGKCLQCEQAKYCAECTNEKCSKCIDGYALIGQDCINCIGTMPHCNQCTSSTKCDVCDYEVAKVDSVGKCSLCRTENNWFANANKCKCDHFVDATDGNKCKTCDYLMPGCDECSYVD